MCSRHKFYFTACKDTTDGRFKSCGDHSQHPTYDTLIPVQDYCPRCKGALGMVLDYGWCYEEAGDMNNVPTLASSSSGDQKSWGPISEVSIAGQCSGAGAQIGI